MMIHCEKRTSPAGSRVVLVISILLATYVWGFSETNRQPFAFVLGNHILVAAITMACFVSSILYVKLRIADSSDSFLIQLNRFLIDYQWWFILPLSAAYVATLTTVSLLRHKAFQTYAFDLGIFDQAVWSTLNGRFLFSSFKGYISLLGDHMSPILAFLVPLYKIWNDARVLLLVQAGITGLSFIPLALIAQEKFGKGLMPVFFALLLFFYQPLRHSVRAEFHPELLANPLIFAAFLFLIQNRFKLFLVALGLLVLCKENMFGISFVFGIHLFFMKRFRMGFTVAAVSLVLFFLVTQKLIPLFSGGRYFYQANYAYIFSGDWGEHPPLIVQPLAVVEYLYKIYLPIGCLSFLHLSTFILTAPILFQNLLSRNPTMHSIAYQYTSGLTPAVFVSSVYGLHALLKGWRSFTIESRLPKGGTLLVLIICSIALAGKPERFYFAKYKQLSTKHTETVQKILRRIPANFSVVANQNLVPHTSHRFDIQQFEDFQRMPKASIYALKADLVLLHRDFTEGTFGAETEKVIRSGYKPIYSLDGFFVFQRTGLEKIVPMLNIEKLAEENHS